MIPLPDDSQRVRVRTSHASLAVEASAGTGKTYLLVVRALWLILVKKLPADSIVAVAFGEKAATELRQRLRAKLEEIAHAPSRDALDPEVVAMAPTEPLKSLQDRACAALEALDRAHISTIHAFASTLIRLYPAEAGVDPGFEVVEDAGFEDVVQEEWSRFIARELGADAERREAWLEILGKIRLTDLADLGRALADFDTDLALLPDKPTLSDAAKSWLLDVARDAEVLAGEIPPGRKKAIGALTGFALAARAGAELGQPALVDRAEEVDKAADLAKADIAAKEMSTRMVHLFTEVTGAAKALRAVPDEATIFAAVRLLVPFALQTRERLRMDGKVTYAGLLALARDLVRNHPEVRRQLNRRFRAILLDEAQDVDPIQLELILFLAETPGGGAKIWREVRLEAGKLFVVGDPKQSIYLFRGADVRAFRSALDLMIAQGAETLTPTTSMRSDQSVLDAVNAVGIHYFEAYPALTSQPDRKAIATGAGTEVLAVEPENGEDVEAVEAAAVAHRISELIKAGHMPGEVAVLFRKRGPMPVFAAALRSAGIEVSIEQERRFYLRQEIMDLMNLLRYIADPSDEVAEIGVLRGPYAGLTDLDVESFLAETRHPERGTKSVEGLSRTGNDLKPTPPHLNELLSTILPLLSSQLSKMPPREWLEWMYQLLGVEAVAAASSDPGARDAVRAFRQMLGGSLEQHGLPRTLELLETSLRAEADPKFARLKPLEPLKPPVADSESAVRFLTVHNAKGLEFPVVILAAIDSTPQAQRSTDTEVLHDFAGGVSGITLKAVGAEEAAATLDGCRLKALRDQAEREETARLVYVALTRARDRLIIVDRRPGNGRKPGRTADTFRPHLAALIEYPNTPASRVISPISRSISSLNPLHPLGGRGKGEVGGQVSGLRSPLEGTPDLITPSDLDERLRRDSDSGSMLPAGTRSARAWLGELCHEVLRNWDFKVADPDSALPRAFDMAIARIGGSRGVPLGLRQQGIELLSSFFKSETGQMLGCAEILGSEVPLLGAREGSSLSARVDIVFRSDGAVTIGDFKLSGLDAPSNEVMSGYASAGSSALGEPCSFVLLPLQEK